MRMRGPNHNESNRGNNPTVEYATWAGVKARCLNPNRPGYKDYGGRGIRICERWKNSYLAFLEDMGRKPSTKHSLDRIDNNGNYEPGNCRWATDVEQRTNKRRMNTRYITFNGERKTLTEWSIKTGIKLTTLITRLDSYGWAVDRALTTKPDYMNTLKRPPILQIKDGIVINRFLSQAKASKAVGISSVCIGNVLSGRQRQTKGFVFAYEKGATHD